MPELGAAGARRRSRGARARGAARLGTRSGFDGRARDPAPARALAARQRPERVIETIVSETGKAYEDAQLLELGYTVSALSFWARTPAGYLGERRRLARSPLLAGRRLATRYVPRGLVGVIGPWNYPLLNSFGDAIPALAAGNSVLLKPSELTPLTSLLVARGAVASAGCPTTSSRSRPATRRTGEALVELVDFVMFTGSTATGRAVAARCGALARAVLARARRQGRADRARRAHRSSAPPTSPSYYGMLNGGQSCVSIERVYVRGTGLRRVRRRLVTRRSRALRVGAPGGPGSVDVGAITSQRAARDRSSRTSRTRSARGARVAVGGQRAARARAASSSRRCCSTSTTRCAA